MTTPGSERHVAGAARPGSRTPNPVAAIEAQLLGTPPLRYTLPALLPPPLRPAARVAVLDVSEFFGESSGGVRTYLLEKARYVESRADLRQVLVVPAAAAALTQTTGVRCYRVHGPRVPWQPPYRFLLAGRQLSRVVAHERPDVIEVGSPGLVPWLVRGSARAAGVPLVHFFHSNYPQILALAGGRSAGEAIRQAAWRYARTLDRLFAATIVASDAAAAELARAGVERTVRIPLGVDLDCFHPRTASYRTRTRHLVGLPNAPLVLFVGRFALDKQLDVVLDAWPEVERRTGAHLLLVGDGPLRRRLQARAGSAAVHWRPFQQSRARLAELFGAADVCLAPSPVETFGLAALEALACGTPLLSAHVGAAAELVVRSGAGSVFEAGSPAALTEALVALLGRDLRTLGHAGRAYAEREHAWRGVFDRLFALYAEIVRDA